LRFQATIMSVRFHSEANGYTVMTVKPSAESIAGGLFDPDDPNDQLVALEREDIESFGVTVVGNMPTIRVGDTYTFEGEWSSHPKYGRQVKVTNATIELPATQAGAVRYLTSIAYGVGPVKAQQIVEALGDNAVQRIQNDPGCLGKLPFLTDDQCQEIHEAITGNQVVAELASLICGEGVTPHMAQRIYDVHGPDSVRIVRENPYMLADTLWGVGFKKADAIAERLGVENTSPYRMDSAVKYALKNAGNDGHVYLTFGTLVESVWELCRKSKKALTDDRKRAVEELVHEALGRLQSSGVVVQEGNAIYHITMLRAEVKLAQYVGELIDRRPILDADPYDIAIDIRRLEAVNNIEYAPEQKQAVARALASPLSIITGGPGVGKSTVIKAIIELYRKYRPTTDNVYLAAPTGRAAKRMTEVTGVEAKTIHRLLRYNPEFGEFMYNEDNPLDGPGLVIVDEFSMCDLELARDLFAAFDRHQVVLVGDIDQLPSVGPGSVLRDLIASSQVPTTRLRFNFRQAGGSRVAEYANLIVDGEVPPLRAGVADGDVLYIEVEDAAGAAAKVEEIVKEAVQKQGLNPMDFQVLAPMHRSAVGVQKLNAMVRDIVNPDDGSSGVRDFRARDKIMVIKNNYDLGVFNGDIGQVVSVGKNSVTADFDGMPVTFADEDLDTIILAYASTIHKSQGSEYPLVIMPLVHSHYIMLQRNLLYTGMTRARERLVLIAERRSIERAIENNKVEQRFSKLAERLQREGIQHDRHMRVQVQATNVQSPIQEMRAVEAVGAVAG
jgi:exodeoxyribonuclease V alpha subunit